MSTSELHDPAPRYSRDVWLTAALVWTTVAVLATTQQWAELRGTVKAVTWLQAFAWQGVSWLLLVPATPALYALVRRYPLGRDHRTRLLDHAFAGLTFGVAFLLVSVPARLAFHPNPIRWSLFGDVFYKSVVPYGGAGMLAYGLVVLAASLRETRARLYATLAMVADAPDASIPSGEAPPSGPARIVVTTPVGTAHLRVDQAQWAEPARGGATLHTDAGPVLVRHRLGELEAMLGPHGFVRVHRSHLVNGHRIREVIGAPSRDGLVRLDTGRTLPVSRRRRAHLDPVLSTLPVGTTSHRV